MTDDAQQAAAPADIPSAEVAADNVEVRPVLKLDMQLASASVA